MVKAIAASSSWAKEIATLPSLDQILDRTPLTFPPDTLASEAIAQMGQTFNDRCDLDRSATASSPALRSSSCILALQGLCPVGILTERDVVRLSITGMDFSQVTLDRVMTQPVVVLTISRAKTIYDVLTLFQQHQIRHLPVVDAQRQLLGIVTRDRLCEILQPANLLKLRQVSELMAAQTICAMPADSILSIAHQMVNQRKSCVVVVEPLAAHPEILTPLGIVTERDMVQFQRLGINFAATEARTVMSAPLCCLKPTDSLWEAQQEMRRLRVRRLVVAGERGELRGILTQTSLLRVFDPVEMAGIIEVMQQQFDRQTQELNRTVQQLGQEIAERQQVNAALQTSQQQLQTANEELEQRVADRTQELSQAEEQFRILATHAPVGILEMDAAGDVVFANHRCLELTGLSLAQVMGKGWEKALHPEDRERAIGKWHEAIETGRELQLEYRYQTPQGRVNWVIGNTTVLRDEAGTLAGYLVTITDITDRVRAENERQQAEAELREQQQLLQQVTESTSAILYVYDLVEQQNVYTNAQIAKVLGYSPEAIRAMGSNLFTNLIHPDDLPRVLAKVDRCFSVADGEVIEEEYRMRDVNGDWHWLQSRDSVLNRNADGTPKQMVGAAIDITTRKQTEEALRIYTQEVEDLYNRAPCGYHSLDENGTFIRINDTELDWLGYSRDEVIGRKKLVDLLTPESLQVFEENFPAFLERGWARDLEFQLVRQDGTILPVLLSGNAVRDASGNYVMSRSTLYDISERKQAEAKIHEQAALLDISTDAIYVRDLDDCILYWNRGAEKLYGWSAAEAIGRSSEELFHTNPAQLETAIATTLDLGSWQGELQKTTQTGKAIVVDSRWSLVKNEVGQPRAILTVSTDITEKKQLEQQFLRAQRLESIGTLASGIAHDLNNILTPVLAVAQLLPLRLPTLDESTQRLLEISEINVKRGSDLAKQILAFARGSKGQRLPLQIGHLLGEIAKIAKETFPKSIEIQTQVATAGLWLVRADVTQIHQAVLNLCVNARDAMPEGGKLTIAAENFPIDRTFARMHLDASVGTYIKISIADTGTGIASDVLDRIFDPFFTTKEPDKGTGLGLSTVLTIVKNHGGFLDVTTQVGRGTSFQVYLPAIERGEELSCPLPTDLEGNGELILVVDDEAAIGETIKATLEEHHYQVLVAEDGIEAIALYFQQQSHIRLVLVDLLMPSFDGLRLMAILAKIDRRVPIIAMSGISSNDLETAIDRECVRAFLTKPFTAQTLLETVRQALTGSHRG
ncbi:MAG: PAS domain S-box protein [Cyanosarcina radialis HA8281-LM2]|jgi:hypothetical protein|nr:PAS domain S-box protein [Cyanosarcina radialis HA8281-LM2]